MKSKVLAAMRSVGAVIAGFALITLGTLFTFLVLVPDFGYRTSSLAELALGTVGALVSGIGGGLLTAWLAGRRPIAHAAALAIPIGLDTASLLAGAAPGADPAWFDLGGSATLLLGALVGGWWIAARGKPAAPAAGSSC